MNQIRSEKDQFSLRVPLPSERMFRSLAVARGLKSPQRIIEPVIVDYAAYFRPLALTALEVMASDIRGITEDQTPMPENFGTTDWHSMIEATQSTIADKYPVSPIDLSEPYDMIGIRIPRTTTTIYRLLSLMEGSTRQMTPLMETIVHGYAQKITADAVSEITDFTQKLSQ